MGTAEYIIITPVRNESQHLEGTIASVAAQTLRPRMWIIVDDGSTDTTGDMIDAAAKKYSWIKPVHRQDRGFRKAGGGVIEAFYDGYNLIPDQSWECLVKLDGDLSFEPSFFSGCMDHFQADAKLGVGGGMICNEIGGALLEEAKGDPPFHVRGATKIYRRACWEAIGGLIKAPGWDTLDEVKANMLGWKTYTFRELKLNHHRIAGGADGAWKNWFKNGRANYVTGYHPLFMMAKCAQRFVKKPYGVAGLGLLSGFLTGYVRGVPQVNDRALVKYLRSQQLNRLLSRPSLWDLPTSREHFAGPDKVGQQ